MSDPGHLPAPATAPPGTLGEREFGLLRALIRRESGIHLAEAKRPLLARRLAKRLRALGLPSYLAYYRRVCRDGDETRRMLDCVTTNETSFFREARQFQWIEGTALPRWRHAARLGLRSRRVRAWSAACSSGEEAYSLAMVLLAGLPAAEGWHTRVLATDLSSAVLETARRGIWPLRKAEPIPPALVKRYLLRGLNGQRGNFAAGPELRSVLELERLNLAADPYPAGPFDLLFCRNVLIYFGRDERRRVIDRLVDRLAPGGLLVVGQAETLHGVRDDLRALAPSIYARSREAVLYAPVPPGEGKVEDG